MKKQSSILSFALSLFFFSVGMGSYAQAQQVKSDVSVSRSISAAQYGSDGRPMVVVTITINKYAYTGPGKIEESFPSDFQAVLISSNRAIFQASSGKADFIWNNIQEDRVITVTYELEAMTKTSGSQTVTGQFFYQNQTFNIDPTSFTIDASNLPAYKPVANNNSSTLDDLFNTVTGNTPAPAPTPVATQPAPNTTASSTQPVPQQTPVTPAQQAPAVISTPVASTPVAAQPTPTPVESTPAPVQQSAPVASTPVAAQPTPTPAESTPAPVQQSAPVVSTPVPTQQSAPVASTPAPAQQQTPVENTTSSASSGSSEGLVYRVQIIVVGDKSKLPRFLKQHNITDQIYYDPANDLPVRVMVGNYGDYNSAKSRCNELKGKGLTEAFVAAYYMGQRISMQDAATHTQH